MITITTTEQKIIKDIEGLNGRTTTKEHLNFNYDVKSVNSLIKKGLVTKIGKNITRKFHRKFNEINYEIN